MPPGCDLGSLENRALAAVERGQMAARERHPHHVLGIDIHAAWAIARRWYFVDFRERSLRRIGLGRIKPHHVPREGERGAPHRAIDRARSDAVEGYVDAPILAGIEWLVRLGVLVALAVTVGIK